MAEYILYERKSWANKKKTLNVNYFAPHVNVVCGKTNSLCLSLIIPTYMAYVDNVSPHQPAHPYSLK